MSRSWTLSFFAALAVATTATAADLSVAPPVAGDAPVAVTIRINRASCVNPDGTRTDAKDMRVTYARNKEYVVLDMQSSGPDKCEQYVMSRTGGDHYNASYSGDQANRTIRSLRVDARSAPQIDATLDISDIRPALRLAPVGRPDGVVFRGPLPEGGSATADEWGKLRITAERDPSSPDGTLVVVVLEKSPTDSLQSLSLRGKLFTGRMNDPNAYWSELFGEKNLKLTRWREEFRLRYAPGRSAPSALTYTHDVESGSGKKYAREVQCEFLDYTTDPTAVNERMEKTRIPIQSGREVLVLSEGNKGAYKMWSDGKAVDKVNSRVFEIAGIRFTRGRVVLLVFLLVVVVGLSVFALRRRATGRAGEADPPQPSATDPERPS